MYKYIGSSFQAKCNRHITSTTISLLYSTQHDVMYDDVIVSHCYRISG